MKAFTEFTEFERPVYFQGQKVVWDKDTANHAYLMRGDIAVGKDHSILGVSNGTMQTWGPATVKTASMKWNDAWQQAYNDAKGLNQEFGSIALSTNSIWEGNRSTWFDEEEELTPQSFSDSLPMGWRKMTHMAAYQHAPSGTIVGDKEIRAAGMSLYDYLESHVDWDQSEADWLPMEDCRA